MRNFRRKLSELDPGERRFAACALLCAPLVEVALRAGGLQRTLRWVELASVPPKRETIMLSPERAEHIIDGVYGMVPLLGRCLPRALVQYGLQRRAGADVRFVVGVKRRSASMSCNDGTIDAHAWVENAAGPARSAEFAPILRGSVP